MPPTHRKTLATDNPFLSYPGSALVVELLAEKWTIPVLHALRRGTKRTGELKRELGTISQKMLTQTLRMLEEHGLVTRTVHPVVPPRVDYALTPMGKSINELLEGICTWVEAHDAALQSLARRRTRRATKVNG